MSRGKKRAVIFGSGAFAQVADFYLGVDSDYEVVGFTVSAEAVGAAEYLGRPLVAFEEIERHFDPADHEMFVAVGYKQMNKVRQRFCDEARAKGYRLLTYICSKATRWGEVQFGDNVFVFEDNTLQPFSSIGSGTVLWSGNHIGHHGNVGDYCFITSHVVLSGSATIGDRCFVGVNAAIADSVHVAEDNLIGPGVVIQRSTEPGEVYLGERAAKFPKDSSRFFK